MVSRNLPARPNLDHLKNEAKALLKAFNEGDAEAVERVRAGVGNRTSIKLSDVHRVLAREYGFTSWARLRGHVQAARGPAEAIDTFLTAVQAQDVDQAKRILKTQPQIAGSSLHVAAVLGHEGDVRRLITEHPEQISTRAGKPSAEPLLFLCFSPFHGESKARDAGLLASARALLDAGANPNTVDGRYGVSALYAVTGMHNVLPVAQLLLERGATPNDGESVFHAAERFHEDALELLLSAGADLNLVGEWGNTPLYFLLRWWDVEKQSLVRQGLIWLLDHGADPNVVCGEERESSLHVAARRGQDPAVVQMLLDRGADVHLRRGDGCTAWTIARRSGFDEIAALLEHAGAQPMPLSPVDELLAACGRGDIEAARRLSTSELIASLSATDQRTLVEAASTGRHETALACVAAGFPVTVLDSGGATALHYAAIHGRSDLVRALIDAGADLEIRDAEHSSTPLGWACYGADFMKEPDPDYPGCVQALLESGARLKPDEHLAAHEGVRAILQEFIVVDAER